MTTGDIMDRSRSITDDFRSVNDDTCGVIYYCYFVLSFTNVTFL
jgi:hypothetical protein